MPSPFAVVLAVLVYAFVQPAWSTTAAPEVRSGAALVIDDESGAVLFAKNALSVQPIASITKLMTAMVVLDAKLDPDERIQIIEDDKSKVKWASSRLRVGSVLSRDDLLRIALMASENRAASALARTYPGGEAAALAAMNMKAKNMGLASTRFDDPTGLSSGNVSTASELATVVRMARRYPIVSEYSTLHEHTVKTKYGAMAFANTNRLVRGNTWSIDLSKTGFIAEAGRCLVMHLNVGTRPVTLVLLDASGRFTPFADAQRIRQWLEPGYTSSNKAAIPRPNARTGAAG
ncbi:MAG: D-alanyl-D-alanine endopeptidase [Burkholderiales bacterium]